MMIVDCKKYNDGSYILRTEWSERNDNDYYYIFILLTVLYILVFLLAIYCRHYHNISTDATANRNLFIYKKER